MKNRVIGVMSIFLIMLLLGACTPVSEVKQVKEKPKPTPIEPVKEPEPAETEPEETESEETPDPTKNDPSYLNIPRNFQRRETAMVTHISPTLINMSYRENGRQVSYKLVNLEQDDGVRKRKIRFCFNTDSLFFEKRDIVTYHISTETCNAHKRPYVALPIKVEKQWS